MDHRFPPLRPQPPLSPRRPGSRALPAPAPDLTILAALVLVVALVLA